MKKPMYTLLLLASFLACEKAEINSMSNSADLPVVQAYLAQGQQVLVQINRQAYFDQVDSLPLSIEGLHPTISVDGHSHQLIETAPGIYSGEDSLVIKSGHNYLLSFEYQNTIVSAATTIPLPPSGFAASDDRLHFDTQDFPPTFPNPITLNWDNPENNFYQISVQNIESDPVGIDFFGGGGDGGGARPQFASTPQQTDNYELGFQDFSFVGTHRIVLSHVTTEYVTLTQDNSSEDTQNLRTPYTNITNGLGIFTGVGTDTLLVEVTN